MLKAAFQTRKTILAASIVSIITGVVLTSCSKPDFVSEAQREATLNKFTCWRMERDNPDIVWSAVGSGSFELEPYASDGSTRAVILRKVMVALSTDEKPTCDKTSPFYEDFVEDLYKYHLDSTGQFDYKAAQEAGLID